MNLQEMIKAIIDKVQWLTRDNEIAHEIAEAKGGVNASANVTVDGDFELIGLIFVGRNGELWADDSGIDLVSDKNLLGGTYTQFDEYDFRYVKRLFEYDDWSGLLLYGMDE
jgi:hypothetical protein